MNASSRIKLSLLAVTADAWKSSGISAPVVSEQAFQKMLARHNFAFAHEDDGSRYIAGFEADQNLRKIANSDPVLEMLYLDASHNAGEDRV